jgi:hypothetical protein
MSFRQGTLTEGKDSVVQLTSSLRKSVFVKKHEKKLICTSKYKEVNSNYPSPSVRIPCVLLGVFCHSANEGSFTRPISGYDFALNKCIIKKTIAACALNCKLNAKSHACVNAHW